MKAACDPGLCLRFLVEPGSATVWGQHRTVLLALKPALSLGKLVVHVIYKLSH